MIRPHPDDLCVDLCLPPVTLLLLLAGKNDQNVSLWAEKCFRARTGALCSCCQVKYKSESLQSSLSKLDSRLFRCTYSIKATGNISKCRVPAHCLSHLLGLCEGFLGFCTSVGGICFVLWSRCRVCRSRSRQPLTHFSYCDK